MDTLYFSQFLQPTLQALREGGESLTQGEMVNGVDHLMRLPEAVMECRHARYSMVREFDYCLAYFIRGATTSLRRDFISL
jgi:hypothetical protein